MFYAAPGRIGQSPIEGGIEITEAQYADALAGMLEGQSVRIEDGEMVVAFPPKPEPEPEPEAEPELPAKVYKLDLFERATDEEAEQIVAAIQAQPIRIRMIFEAAQSFQFDHELWPLLSSAAVELFGEERADILLAPSDPS